MARQGTYNTKLKKAIASVFTQNPTRSFSTADVYEKLQNSGTRANLTSVYRNLDTLTAEGFLLKNQDKDGEKTCYTYAGKTGECLRHLHMRCLKCGKIEHLDCSYMETLAKHLLEDHGFSISYESSVLFGLCEKCRTSEKTGSKNNGVV